MKFSEKHWKYAFFILLTAVIIVVIGVIILFNYYFPSVKEDEWSYTPVESTELDNVFTVHTNRDKLNLFLQNHLTGNYSVHFNADYVIFQTTIPVFTMEVLTEIELKPEVLVNGDIMLHTHSMRVGRLKLPEEMVLQFIKQNIELPEWTNIYPQEKQIHIEMNQIRLTNDIQIFFVEFNLEEDLIIMGVHSRK